MTTLSIYLHKLLFPKSSKKIDLQEVKIKRLQEVIIQINENNSNLQQELKNAKTELNVLLDKISPKEEIITKLQKQLDETISLLAERNDELQESQETILHWKRNYEEQRDKVRRFETSYEQRSLKANNQFLQEKLYKLQWRASMYEKLHAGNYKDINVFKTGFISKMESVLAIYEKRIAELEQLNQELLDELQKVKKEIENTNLSNKL